MAASESDKRVAHEVATLPARLNEGNNYEIKFIRSFLVVQE
jgi:hypothetical protein